MPLDTSIPLQGVNSNDVANKDLAQLQQAQAARGQLALQQYTIAQAKSDFEDQQKMKQAWRQAQGDPTQTLMIASQLGVSPKAVQAFQNQQLELQAKIDAHGKAVDEHGNSLLDQTNKRNSLIQAGLQPLLDAKDDIEFQSKLPGVIQSLKNQSLINGDDALALGKAPNQQAIQDWSYGHNNVDILSKQSKMRTDQETADAHKSTAATQAAKQANEAGSQIEASNQAALQGAGRELTSALSAGPVAYQKALEKLVANDKTGLVAANFPTGDKISQMTPAQAASAIDYGSMTGKDREAANQAKNQLAETQNFHAKELALRQQSTNIQVQMLGLDKQKTAAAMYSAGLGADGKPIPGNDKTLLDPNTQNTSDGRNYIDQDAAFKGMPKGDQIQLKRAAASAGVPMLSAKDAGAVHSADSARNMINDVFQVFIKNSGNSILLKPFQNFHNGVDVRSGANPELEAAQKNFLTSIDTLKSAGGMGSGLRITGAEIQKIGSLMPTLGDTKEQVRQKGIQINNLINDNLNQMLHTVPVKSQASGPADLKSMSTDDLLKQLAGAK